MSVTKIGDWSKPPSWGIPAAQPRYSDSQIEDFAHKTWDKLPRNPDQPSWKQIMAEPPAGKRNPFADMRIILEMHKRFVRAYLENDFDPQRVIRLIARVKFEELEKTMQNKQLMLADMLKKLVRAYNKTGHK